jgi:hypothetical protein
MRERAGKGVVRLPFIGLGHFLFLAFLHVGLGLSLRSGRGSISWGHAGSLAQLGRGDEFELIVIIFIAG